MGCRIPMINLLSWRGQKMRLSGIVCTDNRKSCHLSSVNIWNPKKSICAHCSPFKACRYQARGVVFREGPRRDCVPMPPRPVVRCFNDIAAGQSQTSGRWARCGRSVKLAKLPGDPLTTDCHGAVASFTDPSCAIPTVDPPIVTGSVCQLGCTTKWAKRPSPFRTGINRFRRNVHRTVCGHLFFDASL